MSISACGRKRFNAKSEGVAKTVSPIERSLITSTRCTASQSQRAGANGCGSSSACNVIAASVSTARPLVEDPMMSRKLFTSSVFDSGFFDQHRGNVVANRVDAFTLAAFQRLAVRLELDFGFASGTGEYFQEFL